MNEQNFQIEVLIDASPLQVFNGINNVRGWWSENVEGVMDAPEGEFIYAYKDVHQCKMHITEFRPGEKVEWKVLENRFNFTKDENEWKGNTIVFDIDEVDGKSKLTFTQIGLTPVYECYDVCTDAWTSYIKGSLKSLIETGLGKPNTREHDLNRELIAKWGLPDK